MYSETYYAVCFDDQTLIFDNNHYNITPATLERYAFASLEEAQEKWREYKSHFNPCFIQKFTLTIKNSL